jgi:hypothetical protein
MEIKACYKRVRIYEPTPDAIESARAGNDFTPNYAFEGMQLMKPNQTISNRLGTLAAAATIFFLATLAPQRAQAAAAASDNPCNTSSAIANGLNTGSGFAPWTSVSGSFYYGGSGISGDACTSHDWGMYDGGGVTSCQRPFTSADGTANLQVGQIITNDMQQGGNSGTVGLSLYNSSSSPVFEFYQKFGDSGWVIHDNAGTTITTVPYASGGIRVVFTLTSSTTYSLSVQVPVGGTSYGPFTGTLISGAPPITQLRWFTSAIGSGNNLQVGQMNVSCPTPTVTMQPNPEFVFSGSTATFTVASTTASSPTYQWQLNSGGSFTNIPGATSASYTTPATTTSMNGYQYQCVVTDACGNTINSSAATLTVSSSTAPSITTGPTNAAVCSGSAATFAVTASGPSLSYAWFKHANAGWGSAWTVVNEAGGTIFLGNSTNTLGSTTPCNTTFGSYGNINTSSGESWGLYGGSTGEQATRTFPAALTNGQVFQINMCNGNVDTGQTVGFSLHNASNANLFSFLFTGGGSYYSYTDSTGAHTTSVGYTRTGLQITVIVGTGSPASYTVLITQCGGGTVGYTGTFVTTGGPDIVLLYNNNNTGSDTTISDCYFNSLYAGQAYDNADNYGASGNWSGYDKGDASPISGANSSSYSTSTGNNGDLYYAMAYNSVGVTVSTNATLTVNALPTASISYGGSPYCATGTTSVTQTGQSGGTYSSTAGLSLNASTGAINLGTSTLGTYTVTYSFSNGTCSSTATASVTINALPTASISYGGSPYCATGTANVTQTGQMGGTYSSTSGLSINASTGAINLGTSTSGTYTVTYSFSNGTCSSTATANVTVNALPTITLGTSPSVAYGSTTAGLPYTATTGSPSQYSIAFDSAAHFAGFVDVVLTTLPSSPIAITVPSNVGVASYNGTLTIYNNATGCSSSGTAFTVTVTQAGTSVAVSSSEDPSGYHDSLTFTATLPSDATSTVNFLTNGVLFDTETLSSGSATSLSITNLPRGTNEITVQYAGDSNYLGSTNDLTGGQVVTNHPPVGGTHFLGATLNTTLSVSASALANQDYDADGDTLTITAVSGTSTNGGAVTLSGGNVNYMPVNNYVGPDQFTYTISDGYPGGTATSTADVTVSALMATSVLYPPSIGAGVVNLVGYGIPTHAYDVQRSPDLSTWTTISLGSYPSGITATSGNGIILYSDTNSLSTAYYRLVVH